MQWSTEHVIPASVDRIERVLFDPAMVESIPQFMKGIRQAKLIECREEGPKVYRAVYYYPSVSVPFWVRRVKPEMAEFTEYLQWNRETHSGTFQIAPNMPEHMRQYFNAGGEYKLEAREDGTTTRKIVADLTVKAGMMAGALPELIIIGIIKRQFKREAALLTACVETPAP